MKLQFLCSNVTTRCGDRAGEMRVIAENAALFGETDTKDIMTQLDMAAVFEYLNELGYSVSEKQVAA